MRDPSGVGKCSRQRVRRGLCIAAAALLAACSNDLGDLIKPAPHESGDASAAGAAELPLLVVQPDEENADACAACVQDACVQQGASCLEDDACTAQFGCTSTCSDPGCLQECQGATTSDGRWSPWWDDLYACTFATCGEACRTGQNWACVGKYEWPSPEEPRFTFTLRVNHGEGGGGYHAGERVRMCSAARSCDSNPPLDEGVVDASGRVSFEGTERFSGYFELISPDVEAGVAFRPGTGARYHLPPIARPIERPLFMVYSDNIYEQLGWVLSTDAASIFAGVRDCTGNRAAGVRIELPDAPGVEVVHWSDGGFDASATESALGFAVVPSILERAPGDLVEVRAVVAETGATVAERRITIRNGWVSYVLLAPRAESGE